MESYSTVKIDPATLRAARGDRSPSEIARQLGISYQYLWMIESGKRGISGDILARMCLLYGVTIEDLFQGQNFLPAA
jgi:transcriptional regulator with XRE-family HTH domain